MPKDVTSDETGKIVNAIKEFIELTKEPSGNIYEEEITLFPLIDRKVNETKETYNEAINTLNPFLTISPYEQKIKLMEGRIRQQEEAIIKQEGKIEQNTKKGEMIYENYQPLQKLLDAVNELKKEGKEDGKWIEPFMGSGVVGFNARPHKAIFCDLNPHIIDFYNAIKTSELNVSFSH